VHHFGTLNIKWGKRPLFGQVFATRRDVAAARFDRDPIADDERGQIQRIARTTGGAGGDERRLHAVNAPSTTIDKTARVAFCIRKRERA